MLTVSTGSTPPIRSISFPHRPTTAPISFRCKPASPSTTLIFSTIAATTASFTRRSGTLLAILSVLSSTEAFSTLCPSANARSSDCCTSVRNSASAINNPGAPDMSRAEDPSDNPDSDSRSWNSSSSSSEELSLSLDEESASSTSRSGALSPEREKMIEQLYRLAGKKKKEHSYRVS